MFANAFFGGRFFPGTYWAKFGGVAAVTPTTVTLQGIYAPTVTLQGVNK